MYVCIATCIYMYVRTSTYFFFCGLYTGDMFVGVCMHMYTPMHVHLRVLSLSSNLIDLFSALTCAHWHVVR